VGAARLTRKQGVSLEGKAGAASRARSTTRHATMKHEELMQRISADPNICFGKPCIRGTRIWVSLILDNLADGVAMDELLAAYPQLTLNDIRAALAYGAGRVDERILPMGVERDAA
jgi:uncharacterized protein (DUF433 family)